MDTAGPCSTTLSDEVPQSMAPTTDDGAGNDVGEDISTSVLRKHRPRAMSVATTHPSVESVVVKARRAASSLWILLHAQVGVSSRVQCPHDVVTPLCETLLIVCFQNCVLAGKCPHAGCQEAKLMHLHLKTCPAGSGFSCPTHHHGCDPARKLLEHHRRCKHLRSRQPGVVSCRRDLSQHQHCLICSFVARQARTVLERGSGKSSLSRSVSPARKHFSKQCVSFVVNVHDGFSEMPFPAPGSALKMPPPPPRELYVLSESSGALTPLTPASSPEPMLLSEPDAASILCSLDSQARLPRQGRDRSASNAEILTKSLPIPLRACRRRSASVGCPPKSRRDPAEDELIDTIQEEGSHGSRDSVELDFPL